MEERLTLMQKGCLNSCCCRTAVLLKKRRSRACYRCKTPGGSLGMKSFGRLSNCDIRDCWVLCRGAFWRAAIHTPAVVLYIWQGTPCGRRAHRPPLLQQAARRSAVQVCRPCTDSSVSLKALDIIPCFSVQLAPRHQHDTLDY